MTGPGRDQLRRLLDHSAAALIEDPKEVRRVKVVRVYRPDEERQLQALLLLLRSTPSRRPASDVLNHPRCSPMGFEATDPVKPTSQPVDQTRKDNDLLEESDDRSGRE